MPICSVCNQEKPLDHFYMLGDHLRRKQCKACVFARRTAKPRKNNHKVVPLPQELKSNFKWADELSAWIWRHAEMPNRASIRRTVRCYSTSGMMSHDDNIDVVFGETMDRVTYPLFGNPGARISHA